MNIKPVAGPLPVSPETSSIAKAQAARESAIAVLSPPTVRNPNMVSPEELSAIKAPSMSSGVEQMSSEDEQLDGQNNNIEDTQVVPVKEEPPKLDPQTQNKLSILARKEKALRAKQLQLEHSIKSREDALTAKEAAMTQKEQQYQQGYISKDQLRRDTLKILAESGISYDELTQQIINQQQYPVDPRLQMTIEALQNEITSLKGDVQESKKQATTRQQEAYESAVKQIRTDVKNLVTLDPAFEAIKATRSVEDVVELIKQTYDKDGILLSVEEACQQVEDYLVEEAMKVTQIGKIKQKLNLVTPEKPKAVSPQQTQQVPKQPQPMKTLTNANSGTRKLSTREKAILAFKGEKF